MMGKSDGSTFTRVVLRRSNLPTLGGGTAVALLRLTDDWGEVVGYSNIDTTTGVVAEFIFEPDDNRIDMSFADSESYSVTPFRETARRIYDDLDEFETVVDNTGQAARAITNVGADTLALLYEAARDDSLNEEFAARLAERAPMPAVG